MGSVGKTFGRIGTGILTGGLSEIGRAVGGNTVNNIADFADSAYLPIGGALAGGALLGGAGGMLGGGLGSAMNGGAGGTGGMFAGLGGAGNAALGGSLLGLGMAQDTSIPDTPIYGFGQARPMVNQEMGRQDDLLSQALARQRGINQEDVQGQQNILSQILSQQQGMNQGNMQGQQGLLDQSMGQQRGINQGYLDQLQGMNTQQNDLMGQLMQSQRDQMMQQLTTGPEGEAFRQKYNNLGLLNSGAFNTGLSNQFGNLAAQQQQDILKNQIAQQQAMQGAASQGFQGMTGLQGQGYGNMSSAQNQGNQNLSSLLGQGYGNMSSTQNQGNQNLSTLSGQGYGTQSGLSSAALGRDFGLQDVQTQMDLARAIQEAQQKAQLQQSLIGAGGQVLGAGMGAAGQGSSANPLGSLMGGMGSALGNVYQKFFGGPAQSSGAMGDQPFPQGQFSMQQPFNFPMNRPIY